MCGLVGFAANHISATERAFFKTMLFLDEIRGPHSTGIAAVEKNTDVHIYKRALKASDFLQLDGTSDVISDGEMVLLGHNRYTTVGATNDSNAHPFYHKGIVLAHNGTLRNKQLINKGQELYATDSETVCAAIAENNGEAKEVIERLEGAYALTWYDEYQNTLNLARNSERPLWVGKTRDGVAWSSEKALLELAAAHNKVNIHTIQQLPIGEIWTWAGGKFDKAHKKEEFTPKKPIITTHTTTKQHGKNTYNHSTGTGGFTTNSYSLVGKVLDCFSPSVNVNGFCEAVTEDGDTSLVALPTELAAKARTLGSEAVIRGLVISTHERWLQGRKHITVNLSKKDVMVLTPDEWVELDDEEQEDSSSVGKHSCHLCDGLITSANSGEEHLGRYYHSHCLDYLDHASKGAL